MKIHFLGAAEMVTGSNFLIETGNYKILLDCGMFQGSKTLERLNREEFPFSPKEIDYLLLSHSHIDHSGRIPKLVKEGFRGEIICTKATKDLAALMLEDSGHIQEADTQWENKKRERAGKPPLEPIYTVEDAKYSLRYFTGVLYNQKISLNRDITVRFKDAGHILGSAIIELWIKEGEKTVKIVYSGDLGMKNKPLIKDPEIIEEADYLILESTYGDRNHEDVGTRMEKLIKVISDTVARGGTVIIPSFAVGRTQELIYELNKYYEYDPKIEEFMKIPIYLDSPMALSATEIFKRNADNFDEETKELILKGDNPLDFDNLYFVRDIEHSMALNREQSPKVIISASGMATAGRVRHHLKHNLWNPANSIVFVGYQAEGTLGRILKDGAKKVKLFGEEVAVKAEIHSIEGFSGHADQGEILEWLKGFKKKPKKIFLVHGEQKSAATLQKLIEEKYSIKTVIPNLGCTYEMSEDVLRQNSEEQIDLIKKKELITQELQGVYNQFEHLVWKTDKILDEKRLEKDYEKLYNKLLEIQKELLDLNMLLGK
ncbi:metallo-beta-lactamase family protein [Anaerobranca californiensis DSM 14826]|uniref:Metallo-beta-lactamase family protein n=1 Tax=Anaerobranca californiensis DSM 14826 TaxID=1120989 RepID=A0A1M6QB84_9FIRM|nr:MBL fold metallo-hydrolase RNA specificity domain-containing protein [Anaerobranca californiensis]SHK17544.1 metallo-beta-lactamase family protein [Anaerobranca californiensis DSM 14826]